MKPLVITLPATAAPGCTIEIGPARESTNNTHTQVWLNTDLCPFDELSHDLPDECWILKIRDQDLYACYCEDGVHGLCAFIELATAAKWSNLNGLRVSGRGGIAPTKVAQDELLQIAMARPGSINAIHFFDKEVAKPAHTFYFR